MRAVLIPIADAANRDGDHAHPGKEAIIEGSLYGRSAVTAAIRRLIQDRWIEVEEWGRGRGQATVYRVLMGRPPSTSEPVLEPPKVPKCGPTERANSWPLSREEAAISDAAGLSREKGRRGPKKGPIGSAKAAAAPTWIASPTETLSTETLPTRSGTSAAANADELPFDLRAGSEVQEPQPTDPGPDLLAAVAAAAPACCRPELLDDPDQDAGRSVLRRRLVFIASQVGVDRAVQIVAGEWPMQVASAMAHANARARSYLEGPAASTARWRPSGPDPLDGIADATAALAERALAREAELADQPRGGPPPAWKAELHKQLHRTSDGETS